ncbi:MAG: HEPN domain-containing protein [Halobacteriota archaeon]
MKRDRDILELLEKAKESLEAAKSLLKDFIKTGIFPQILHRYLADAFDLRQLGDYGSSGSISEGKAQELIEHAKEFIEIAEEYLRKGGYALL